MKGLRGCDSASSSSLSAAASALKEKEETVTDVNVIVVVAASELAVFHLFTANSQVAPTREKYPSPCDMSRPTVR